MKKIKEFLDSELMETIVSYFNATVLLFLTIYNFCIANYPAMSGWAFALTWFALYTLERDSRRMWRSLAYEVLNSFLDSTGKLAEILNWREETGEETGEKKQEDKKD